MQGKIGALQACRGIAAMVVVLHHANLYTDAVPLLVYGKRGVDFFFILSGFIIYHANAGREFDPRRYAVSRLRRIFIPYLPIGLAMVADYWLTNYQGPWSLFASVTLLPAGARPALSVAWTLQYELMFYGISALLFLSGKPRSGAILWGALVLTFPGQSMPTSLYCLEFVAGFLVAPYCADFLRRITAPAPLVYLGDASYSVYLAHVPVMGVVWRFGSGGPAMFAALVIIPTIAGLAYHRFYEAPMLRLAAAKQGGNPARLPTARKAFGLAIGK